MPMSSAKVPSMLKPASSAVLLLLATPALAEPSQVTGKEIHEMVAGSIIEIDTPLGSKMPVQYSENGEMFGQARGSVAYLGSSTDTGIWWVERDQLCHKWERWFEARPHCLSLMREGTGLRWRWQDGTSGAATITKPQPLAAAPMKSLPAAAPPVRRPPAIDTSFRQSLGAKVAPAESLPSPDTTAPKPRQASFKVVKVDRFDVLNMRNGPSSEFPAVGSIPADAGGVVVTGPCRSRWCPVAHHDVSGWVKRSFLESERDPETAHPAALGGEGERSNRGAVGDPPDARRTCLTAAARDLLERIEGKFGPVQLVSTCRSGATIAGSGRPSRHASGNAIDFNAGSRKQAVVDWLIATHRSGGTMTYSDMDHIHVDIGPHFVSLGGSSGKGGGRYALRRWRSSGDGGSGRGT